MADLHCDFCTDNLAEFIVGNISNGEQQLACRFDFARLGLSAAKLLLPREEIIAAIPDEAPADAAPAENGSPAQPGGVPKRGRKRRSEPEPAPTETLAPDATTVKDG
jgi:hypothetical protein